MPTMIITGGAGFIGSNFILYMLREHPDRRIVCLDKLTYAGSLSNLGKAPDLPDFRFIKADICDSGAVLAAFEEERPDIVVNFAAESHVDRSIEDPGIFAHTNVSGTAILLDAAVKYGVRRFHQVSTDEVYGELPLGSGQPPFTEEAPLRPSSPYSASKAGADMMVLAFHKTYGLPVSISRSSNVYGPRQFPEKLIPLFIKNALEDKPLPLYGSGLNMRNWLYIDDACKAIDLIIHKGGGIYNICGRNEMRNIDIARLICRELGKPESLITYVKDRKGHDLRYAVDDTKIRRELCWQPEVDFERGLKETAQWYRAAADLK